jgi:hypothetical protein
MLNECSSLSDSKFVLKRSKFGVELFYRFDLNEKRSQIVFCRLRLNFKFSKKSSKPGVNKFNPQQLYIISSTTEAKLALSLLALYTNCQLSFTIKSF